MQNFNFGMFSVYWRDCWRNGRHTECHWLALRTVRRLTIVNILKFVNVLRHLNLYISPIYLQIESAKFSCDAIVISIFRLFFFFMGLKCEKYFLSNRIRCRIYSISLEIKRRKVNSSGSRNSIVKYLLLFVTTVLCS